MNYFKNGLSREELDAEYKKLAKQYHPDVCKDVNANQIMANINNEYDEYFTLLRYDETGYNEKDIKSKYDHAYEISKKIILVYMLRNKQKKEVEDVYGIKFDWSTQIKHYYNDMYVIPDDGDSWNYFHGGFAVVEISDEPWRDNSLEWRMLHPIIKAKKLDLQVEFPDYGDMYFHMRFGCIGGNFIKALEVKDKKYTYDTPDLGDEMIFEHIIYNGQHIWIRKTSEYQYLSSRNKTKTYGYMKVNSVIMECTINFDIKKYSEFVETVPAKEFGYFVFQDCSKEEFKRTHDVGSSGYYGYYIEDGYVPEYSDAVNCKLLKKDFNDLYWIDDPVVAHFARIGVVEFYQSKFNFKMRWGRFNEKVLEANLHQLSIDDAERIQDFLDDTNGSFEEEIKRMIKKGKIKLDTSLRDAWGRKI